MSFKFLIHNTGQKSVLSEATLNIENERKSELIIRPDIMELRITCCYVLLYYRFWILDTITRTAVTYALLNGLIQLYLNLGHYTRKGKKVKFTLEEAMKVQSGRNIALPLTSALDFVGGQRHASPALPTGKIRYSLYRRLGGPRSVLDGCGKPRLHRDSIPGPSSL
jgi:hypothetical protein